MNFMKNQLPINQKTFPNCYSHDAIYNAILSSKENIDENFAVIDNVRGFGNENVKVDLENATYFYDHEKYKFKANLYSDNVGGSIYVKSSDVSHIDFSFHVTKHSNWHPRSSIGVFIDVVNSRSDGACKTNKLYVCAKKGLLFHDGIREIEFYDEKVTKNNYWLKVTYRNNMLQWLYSTNGEKWIVLKTENIETLKHVTFGINFDFRHVVYYDWFFSRYFNISYSIPLYKSIDGTPIEFFSEVQKNYDNYTVHHLLCFYKIPPFELSNNKIDIVDLIQKSIDNNCYVELLLDEFYISDRPAFQKCSYFHNNLINGYDEDKKLINIIGYNEKGKFIKSEISYDNFKLSFRLDKGTINLITIEYPYIPYKIKLDKIILILKNYLESVNLSKAYEEISGVRQRCYGFSIYEQLLDDNFDYFLEDRRISHFLYEHKRVFRMVIDFLFHRRMLNKNDLKYYSIIFQNIENKSLLLQNIVIKNKIMDAGEEMVISKIKFYLNELAMEEYRAVQELIETLIAKQI